MRVAPVFELSEAQEAELTRLARSVRSSVRMALRARIVLLAAQGLQNQDIARHWAWAGCRSRAGASATCNLAL